MSTSRICHIEIDESNLAPPTPEIEQERRVAVFDLLEDPYMPPWIRSIRRRSKCCRQGTRWRCSHRCQAEDR